MDERRGRNVELGVQIQVLRIAERRQHAAEVCSNVLHDEGECHVLFLVRGAEDVIAQRQKGQQRHVVGDEHRADEGDINQR